MDYKVKLFGYFVRVSGKITHWIRFRFYNQLEFPAWMLARVLQLPKGSRNFSFNGSAIQVSTPPPPLEVYGSRNFAFEKK